VAVPSCLREQPGPDPVPGGEEEDRAEHGQDKAGEDLDRDAGTAQCLPSQRTAVVGHPVADLLTESGQVDGPQVERWSGQGPLDVGQTADELRRQPAKLPGDRVGDEREDAAEREDCRQQRHHNGQTPGQRSCDNVDEGAQESGDDQADEYGDRN
jgi:hypothetical protein